jgi:hypothetical protein
MCSDYVSRLHGKPLLNSSVREGDVAQFPSKYFEVENGMVFAQSA